MAAKVKEKVMKILRRSCITGNAVWIGPERSRSAEWEAYRKACNKEIERMRQWPQAMARRKKNIMQLINTLTAKLPKDGDISKEQRDALKVLTKMVEKEPSKQSDFYDHIQEEKRQKRNARRREKRWQEKYGNKNKQNSNYDKQGEDNETTS